MNNLSDEAIRKMSPAEADAYAERYPDEALHIAKVFAASTVKQIKKSLIGANHESKV